jgi:hypothetical protein
MKSYVHNVLSQYTEGVSGVTLGVFAFCGDETMRDEYTHVLVPQNWAHRNAQRAHSQNNPAHTFVRLTIP